MSPSRVCCFCVLYLSLIDIVHFFICVPTPEFVSVVDTIVIVLFFMCLPSCLSCPQFAHDGRETEFHESLLLNFRKAQSWDLMVNDIREWVTRYQGMASSLD